VTGKELAGRTSGTKRGATSSSQPSREEGTGDAEEQTPSPPKGKGPLEAPDEQRAKRAHQTTPPETHVRLQRTIGDVPKAIERVLPDVNTVPFVK
jgi:hypothetical protein